jgi:hypothetical protein
MKRGIQQSERVQVSQWQPSAASNHESNMAGFRRICERSDCWIWVACGIAALVLLLAKPPFGTGLSSIR